MERQASPFRAVVRLAWPFALLNLLQLTLYRWLFVRTYVAPEGREDLGAILRCGFRLDLALISAAFALIVIVSILRGRIALRWVSLACIGITGLNLAFSTMNFVFYGVRGEPMGRLLIANVTSPAQMSSVLFAFAGANPALMGIAVALLAGFTWAAVRLQRRVPRQSWSTLRPPRGLALAIAAFLFLLAPIFHPIEICEGDVEIEGWTVDLLSAHHFQRFDDHVVHQAIPNPLHELVFTRLPQALASLPPPRLDPEEALQVLHGRLPGKHLDAEYPLLRQVESAGGFGLEHVLIIQVEGLSGSIVERVEDGRKVMPFLSELASRSLYFPNTLQTYPTTYGGMHGLTASLPRTTSCITRGRFTYDELQGSFGSLPRILDRRGLFLHGARTCAEDKRAYMGNLGFTTSDYRALRAELERAGRTKGEIEGGMGVWDLPCLVVAADRLLAAEEPTVVQVMTSTSHCPWTVPEGYPVQFEDYVLSTQRYVDDAIRACLERLATDAEVLERTLVIVTADHVSLAYGTNELDSVRIPLIFYNPRFAALGLARRETRWATLPDVVPTTLAMLGGTHRYAGLGRDLLAPERSIGALFSNEEAAFYVEGDRLLRFDFQRDRVTIHAADPSGWGNENLRHREPERSAAMEHLFFGLLEGTRRAMNHGRVYPR